ncbi:MAG TPA: DUF2007 domain-containing protein [Sulfurovum sp.]|nr:DUF2007 domain-containing protein [Sulfurovum sp.]
MNNNQHIEIARLFLFSDAHILRGLLEVENIEVFMFDEGFSSLEPATAVISGGVKIHVPYKDKDMAMQITEEFFTNMKMENITKCPNCESSNVSHDYKSQFKHFLINLITIMGGTNASRGVRYYKYCSDCGYDW